MEPGGFIRPRTEETPPSGEVAKEKARARERGEASPEARAPGAVTALVLCLRAGSPGLKVPAQERANQRESLGREKAENRVQTLHISQMKMKLLRHSHAFMPKVFP